MEELIEQYAMTPAKKRYGGLAVIIFLLFGVYYITLNDWQQSDIRKYHGRVAKKTTERNKKQQYVRNMEQYEARFNDLGSDLEHARNIIPDTANVPQLLSQLDSRARQSGLTIDRFEPLSEVQHSFYADMAFSLSLVGSYHEIAMFVDAVGKMDRVVNVSGISMTAPQSEDKRVILNGDFTIKTYRFMTEAEEAAAAKKKKNRRRH